jgi:hypothetical protein
MYSTHCKNPVCGKALKVHDGFTKRVTEVRRWSVATLSQGGYSVLLSDGELNSDSYAAKWYTVQACECGQQRPAGVWPRWAMRDGVATLEAWREPMRQDPKEWHPEQREDEVFIGNCALDGFQECGWKTRRLGFRAYGRDGHPLNDHIRDLDSAYWERHASRPMFVKTEELRAAGFEIDTSNGTIKGMYAFMDGASV